MVLVVDQLSGRERGGEQIHRIAFHVAAGECLVVIGPPGCGTALLFRLLAGELAPTQGSIRLVGCDIEACPAQQRPLRCLDLDSPLPLHRSLTDLIGEAAIREGLTDMLGLSGLERRPLAQLATELRLRVALAIALATHPACLLIAEPGSSIGPALRAELYALIATVRQTYQLAVLVATSEPDVAFALADRVAVMHGGRIVESGTVQEIYLRPQTDVGAMALGPANLLVGACTDDGVRVGPFVFAMRVGGGGGETRPRVQLMFRPEDVEVTNQQNGTSGAVLGWAEVVLARYAGALEHLRLRLAPVAGVRPIAPAPPFGEPGILVDAVRPSEQVRRMPLRRGDRVWVGVRRFHALPHPGLHLALLGSSLTPARQLATLAAARLSLVEPLDEPPAEALARLHRHHPCDVVIVPARGAATSALVERLLERGEQHILLLDELRPTLSSGLICVAGDERDKATVSFAARLLRHLGVAATLLTVLPDQSTTPSARIERFHAAARDTLAALGVAAQSLFRTGRPADVILAERQAGNHDLVVVGTPNPQRHGSWVLNGLVRQASPIPLLIVRPAGIFPASERPVLRLFPGLLADVGLFLQ